VRLMQKNRSFDQVRAKHLKAQENKMKYEKELEELDSLLRVRLWLPGQSAKQLNLV